MSSSEWRYREMESVRMEIERAIQLGGVSDDEFEVLLKRDRMLDMTPYDGELDRWAREVRMDWFRSRWKGARWREAS